MKNTKKKYEKKRDEIRDDKNSSELEKSGMNFNNWINYIAECGKNNNPKYTREQLKIHV